MDANSYDNPGNSGGNLESVMENLSILEPEGTPFTSMVKKTRARATFPECVADTLRKPRVGGSREGQNASGGNNKAKERKRFGTWVGRVFDEFGVTDVQQDVTTAGGNAVTDSEYGSAKAKCLREIKRDVCAMSLSNVETQGGDENEMRPRGAFKWLSVTAQTVHAVPATFRPVAAQIQTGVGTSVPLFTEPELVAQCKAIKQVYGQKVELDLMGGDDVVHTIDAFSRLQGDGSTYQTDKPVIEMDGKKRKVVLMVQIFDCSFARLSVMPNQFLRFAATSEDGETNAGLLLNMKLWEQQYLEELMAKDEEDHGGGETGWIRGKFANMCLNPKGNGAIYNT